MMLCSNCEYRDVNGFYYPCNKCSYYSRWTPIKKETVGGTSSDKIKPIKDIYSEDNHLTKLICIQSIKK